MLSIGKLGAGQAEYYLEQAHAPVTRARAVGSGVEDYYLAGPEAPGRWLGAGPAPLGLSGTVGEDELRRVLAGQHPVSEVLLGRRPGGKRVPGFDLTFSAPKSVSVLFGIGDERLREVIAAAHDRAIEDALGYVERQGAVTRRGAGGVHSIRGHGLIAAAFRHRTSRAGDPQLHTHVLVANLTLGADGRWSALDGRRIYAHAKTAGYLYQARLRAELSRELGVEWTPVRNGIADIDGVPATVLRAFSRRRAEIDAELERHGTRGPAAAQVAALETRRRKDYRVTPEQLVPEWRQRAVALGLVPERLRSLLGRATPTRLDPELEEAIAVRLAGPTGLTHRRSTFTRRDVIQGFCEALPPGTEATVAQIEASADRFLRSERVVVLAVGERRAMRSGVLRRHDGRVVSIVPDERSYSTPELLALERRILQYATDGRDAGVGRVRDAVVDRVLVRRPTLAAEQGDMVRRLTLDGDAVAVILGQAGTGKTFALAAAREAWDAGAHTVIGAALARRAARELEDGAGIASTSVAALLAELRARPVSALPRRSVLVIDEAGMVGTRQLAELVDHAARARAKLVLVGDYRQLPEIEAGGAFRALTARLPAIVLTGNRRQVAAWERATLAQLRDGDADEALRRYEAHGRVVTGDSADAVRGRLVTDWWTARDRGDAVMIAYRRVDVAELNDRARTLMRAAGVLGDEELRLSGVSYACGDQVVLRSNDRRLGVANGDRGSVLAVDAANRSVDVAIGGRRVHLDAAYLDRHGRRTGPSLQHGYAITGHSAQGLTCDEAFVLVTNEASREWSYTALSRGRQSNRLYAMAPETPERAEYAPGADRRRDARAALLEALGRPAAKSLATDEDEGWDRGDSVLRRARDRGVGRGL
jgi:conjugative relaxase-like TrwC/TraI family protein